MLYVRKSRESEKFIYKIEARTGLVFTLSKLSILLPPVGPFMVSFVKAKVFLLKRTNLSAYLMQ